MQKNGLVHNALSAPSGASACGHTMNFAKHTEKDERLAWVIETISRNSDMNLPTPSPAETSTARGVVTAHLRAQGQIMHLAINYHI